MRCGVLICAVCLCIVGVSRGGEAVAAIRRMTNIPAEPLELALQTLAKQRDLQVIYQSELVGERRTAGAVGQFTAEEALGKLLEGTGLTYRYLNDSTITIVPLAQLAPSSGPDKPATRVDPPTELPRPSSSDPFRLAQVDSQPAAPARSGSGLAAGDTESNTGAKLEEVVVTSTRQAEPLSKVPISVAVLTDEQMQAQGVKEFQDIARLTPGLTLNTGYGGSNNIAIRGVASNAGAATTGIYIDDVPIQTRQLAFTSATLFPEVFDLERVEVLRGPQGTLFGSGSEGGTVRFIQRGPDLKQYSGQARVEGSQTQGSAQNYEAGAAFGGPIIDGVLGFRLSAYHRRDGGWIDLVPGTVTVNDPTGATYARSATLTPTGPARTNVNSSDVTAARLALKLALGDSFTLAPSFFYQKQHLGDPTSTYTLFASDPGSDRYVSLLDTPGPVTPGGFTQLHSPRGHDGAQTRLTSLNAQWDFAGASLYSTTAYADQMKQQVPDITPFYSDPPLPGEEALNWTYDSQQVFTQELRLQSSVPDSRVKWVTGAFYSRSTEKSFQYNENNMFANGSSFAFYGAPAVAGGDPFGPGYSAFENTFGVDPIDDSGTYSSRYRMVEEQLAGFGQADLTLGKFTLTAGVRVSRDRQSFTLLTAGAENNLNPPFGAPCPTGGFCPFGSGPFAPAFANGTVHNKETSVTPKFGVSYQALDGLLAYASASKGFRPGGGQLPLPTFCGADEVSYGYVDASGNPRTPLTFKSDTVWNYEVGQKLRALNGKLSVDSSVYLIKWNQIQQNITMPVCGFSITDNLGSATIKGFDFLLRVQPLSGLTVSASVGYTHTKLDQGLLRPDGSAAIPAGSAVTGAGAPWNVTLSPEYDFPIKAEYEGYARADYTYRSEVDRTLRQDPRSFNYDPLLLPDPATSLLNMRVGLRREVWDASLFVNNLLDAHPLLGLNRNGMPNYYWQASTFRPRTYGVTLTYRFGK